jgi:SSS family solute:Na+ symporter
MATKIIVLGGYFLVVLIIGMVARTHWKSSPETYFLADRRLGPLVLLGTMVATNFSAFTVFGTSGAGYRDGYAFFPIMGFGTGFMALTFWILGRRIWEIGRQHGLVTPPELVAWLYASRPLGGLFAAVMIVFTLPYLALQPMAAGYALEALIGLPYFYGCLLVTGIIMAYTLRGGMRAVAWTDLFQGLLMAVLLLASLVLVVRHHGGLAAANQQVLSLHPELFARPGGQGSYTPAVWFSYMLLWFFCDPMFPQLFQRFFTARRRRTLSQIMLCYPLVCTVVFFMPVAIGVIGRLSFPGLEGKAADRILPLVVTQFSGDAMAALVMAAGLAALMSTMDSQLLTLSSIFTRDILAPVWPRAAAGALTGRLCVVVLSLCGLALAYRPPDTILQIATETFTGLAVLFPTVIFGLYLKRRHPLPALASILVGEGLLVAFHFQWLPSPAFLPVVWIMLATFSLYLLLHAALDGWRLGLPSAPRHPYGWMLAGIFVASVDLWAWHRIGPLVWGVPAWIGYFVLLSALQTAVMFAWVRTSSHRGPSSA